MGSLTTEPQWELQNFRVGNLFYLIFLSFVFLGLHPRHMEVPRLGVQSELQLLTYVTATAMQDPSCF